MADERCHNADDQTGGNDALYARFSKASTMHTKEIPMETMLTYSEAKMQEVT